MIIFQAVIAKSRSSIIQQMEKQIVTLTKYNCNVDCIFSDEGRKISINSCLKLSALLNIAKSKDKYQV